MEIAFGVDDAPLALASAGVHAPAGQVLARAREPDRLRAEITLNLRDIAKVTQAVLRRTGAGDRRPYPARTPTTPVASADAERFGGQHVGVTDARLRQGHEFCCRFGQRDGLNACRSGEASVPR